MGLIFTTVYRVYRMRKYGKMEDRKSIIACVKTEEEAENLVEKLDKEFDDKITEDLKTVERLYVDYFQKMTVAMDAKSLLTSIREYSNETMYYYEAVKVPKWSIK